MKRIGFGRTANWVVVALCLAVMGCEPPGTEKAAKTAYTSGAQDSSDADLQSMIGDYMPPLEGGSLEIAAPRGWEWSRAGADYLVGFHEKGSSLNNLPRILVSVEDSPYPGITDIDDTNIKDLVAQVSKSLAGKELKEAVAPVTLGKKNCARFVDFAKKGNAVVARQTLKTVAGGRLYTIRLDVHAPQFSKFERAAYAVAASMKFSGATASSAPTPVEEPPASEEAEEEPTKAETEEEPPPTESEPAPASDVKESE